MSKNKIKLHTLEQELAEALFQPTYDSSETLAKFGNLKAHLKKDFLIPKGDIFAERAEYTSAGLRGQLPLLSEAVLEITTTDVMQALYDLTFNFHLFLKRSPDYTLGASFTREFREFHAGELVEQMDGDLHRTAALPFTDAWGEKFYESMSPFEVFWASDKLHLDYFKQLREGLEGYWADKGPDGALARLRGEDFEERRGGRPIGPRQNPGPTYKATQATEFEFISTLESEDQLWDFISKHDEFARESLEKLNTRQAEDYVEGLYEALRIVIRLESKALESSTTARRVLDLSQYTKKKREEFQKTDQYLRAKRRVPWYSRERQRIYERVANEILELIRASEQPVSVDTLTQQDAPPMRTDVASLESEIFKTLGVTDLTTSLQAYDPDYYNVDPLFTVFVACGMIEFVAKQLSAVYGTQEAVDSWRLVSAFGLMERVGQAISNPKSSAFKIKSDAYRTYSEEPNEPGQGVFLTHGKRLAFTAKNPSWAPGGKALGMLIDSQGYLIPSFVMHMKELKNQRVSIDLGSGRVKGFRSRLPTYYSKSTILSIFDRTYNISANERNYLIQEGASVEAVPAVYPRVQLFKSLRELLNSITDLESASQAGESAEPLEFTLQDCPVWLHLVYTFLGIAPKIRIVPSSQKDMAIVYKRINPSKGF